MRRYKGELPPSNRTWRESAPSQLSNLSNPFLNPAALRPSVCHTCQCSIRVDACKWLTAAIIGGQESTDVEVSRAILYCTMVETPLSKVGVINEGAPTEIGSQMCTRSSVV